MMALVHADSCCEAAVDTEPPQHLLTSDEMTEQQLLGAAFDVAAPTQTTKVGPSCY